MPAALGLAEHGGHFGLAQSARLLVGCEEGGEPEEERGGAEGLVQQEARPIHGQPAVEGREVVGAQFGQQAAAEAVVGRSLDLARSGLFLVLLLGGVEGPERGVEVLHGLGQLLLLAVLELRQAGRLRLLAGREGVGLSLGGQQAHLLELRLEAEQPLCQHVRRRVLGHRQQSRGSSGGGFFLLGFGGGALLQGGLLVGLGLLQLLVELLRVFHLLAPHLVLLSTTFLFLFLVFFLGHVHFLGLFFLLLLFFCLVLVLSLLLVLLLLLFLFVVLEELAVGQQAGEVLEEVAGGVERVGHGLQGLDGRLVPHELGQVAPAADQTKQRGLEENEVLALALGGVLLGGLGHGQAADHEEAVEVLLVPHRGRVGLVAAVVVPAERQHELHGRGVAQHVEERRLAQVHGRGRGRGGEEVAGGGVLGGAELEGAQLVQQRLLQHYRVVRDGEELGQWQEREARGQQQRHELSLEQLHELLAVLGRHDLHEVREDLAARLPRPGGDELGVELEQIGRDQLVLELGELLGHAVELVLGQGASRAVVVDFLLQADQLGADLPEQLLHEGEVQQLLPQELVQQVLHVVEDGESLRGGEHLDEVAEGGGRLRDQHDEVLSVEFRAEVLRVGGRVQLQHGLHGAGSDGMDAQGDEVRLQALADLLHEVGRVSVGDQLQHGEVAVRRLGDLVQLRRQLREDLLTLLISTKLDQGLDDTRSVMAQGDLDDVVGYAQQEVLQQLVSRLHWHGLLADFVPNLL